MEKFSLFIENENFGNILGKIFANPFQSSPKFEFANWLGENGKTEEYHFISLGAKYQQNGNVWPDDRMEKRYLDLSNTIRSRVKSSGYLVTSDRLIRGGANDKNNYLLTGDGVFKSKSNTGFREVPIEELSDSLIDAIVYSIGLRMASPSDGTNGEADVDFKIALRALEHSLKELSDDTKLNKDNLNDFVYAARTVLSTLSHNPKLTSKYDVSFGIKPLLDKFIRMLNGRKAWPIRNLGFDISVLQGYADKLIQAMASNNG